MEKIRIVLKPKENPPNAGAKQVVKNETAAVIQKENADDPKVREVQVA